MDDVVIAAHRDVIVDGLPKDLQPVDAAFFDLPDASAVVEEAKRVLKTNGVFCAFCPCAEQSLRVSETLRKHHFYGTAGLTGSASDSRDADVRTIETLTRRFEPRHIHVQEVAFGLNELPPLEPAVGQKRGRRTDDEVSDDEEGAEMEMDAEAADEPASATAAATTTTASAAATAAPVRRIRKVQIQTKPFPDLRGHTGYLTYARKAVDDTIEITQDSNEPAAAEYQE